MGSTLSVSVRAVPQLDALGIVSADLDRSRAFYRLLDIEVAAFWGHRYAQLSDTDGVHVDLFAAL